MRRPVAIQKVSAWFRDRRFGWAYYFHAKRLQSEHAAEVEAKFPLTALKARIEHLREQAVEKADAVFCDQLKAADRQITVTESALRARKRELDLLERDLNAEIRDIDYRLDVERSRHTALRTEALEIESEINDVRREIEAFHEGRTDMFGNPVRLPQWSFFGQSWSDLDALHSEIGRQQAAKNDRFEAITAAKKLIEELRSKRDLLYRQRREKQHHLKLGRTASSTSHAISLLQADLRGCKADRDAIVQAIADEKARNVLDLGIPELETELKIVEDERASFNKAFEAPEAEARRKALFRAQWLKQHNLPAEIAKPTS